MHLLFQCCNYKCKNGRAGKELTGHQARKELTS